MAPLRNKRVETSKPYIRNPLSQADPLSGDEEDILPSDISPEQQRAWQAIATKLNQRFGGSKTWEDCARRWNGIYSQTMKKMETFVGAREGVSPGTAPTSPGFTKIEKAVLKAINMEQDPLEIHPNTNQVSQSTPQQSNSNQTSDHCYSTQGSEQNITTTQEIKEEKDDDDITIKEEVEIDELEEFNDQVAQSFMTQGNKDKIEEIVPALIECVKSISNLANAMCGAIEDLRKLTKNPNSK